MDNEVLNPSTGETFRATDPVILPQPYASPADFAAQYPTPLDTTELIAMCEEVSLFQFLPDQPTALKQEYWRELTSLAFMSGSEWIAFADGECPEEYTHDGANTSVDLKNLGAKKTLSLSDIKHSIAVAAGGYGINALVGAIPSSEGLPGGANAGTITREAVRGVKEKEMTLATILVMNGIDRLMVQGNKVSNSLEFDGIENWATNMSCTHHTNDNDASGTFGAGAYDRFLSESCAKPTHLLGAPQSMQEVLSAYFQLGFAGSQVVNFPDGNRIVPGINYAGQVNTGIGRLTVVADSNFRRTNIGGGNFQADVWSFRMTHNGEPLVYTSTQFPLGLNDLVPGCTAISFEIWTKQALVIKHCCAHGKYTSQFTGRIVSTCPVIG